MNNSNSLSHHTNINKNTLKPKQYVLNIDRCPLFPEYYNPMYLWSDAFNNVVFICTPYMEEFNHNDLVLKHYYLLNYQNELVSKINEVYFSITGIHINHIRAIVKFFNQFETDEENLKRKFLRKLLSNAIYITSEMPYIYIVNIHLSKIDRWLLYKYHQNELEKTNKEVIDRLLKWIGSKLFNNLCVIVHPNITKSTDNSEKNVLDKLLKFSFSEMFFPHIDEKYSKVFLRVLDKKLNLCTITIQELQQSGKIYDRTKYHTPAPLSVNEVNQIVFNLNEWSIYIQKFVQDYPEFKHILEAQNYVENNNEIDFIQIQQRNSCKMKIFNLELIEEFFKINIKQEMFDMKLG